MQVDAVTYDQALDRIADAAKTRQGLAVSATAVHGLMEAVLNKRHRARLNSFDLVTPDGQPVRWALNWLHGSGLPDRVCGPKLMLALCERAANDQIPIYLYGSTPAVLARLTASLQDRFPDLAIAGSSPSQFGMLDTGAQWSVAAHVRSSGAGIVFVGLGCPRQETFCWGMRHQIGLPLIAVGAAFDFHAGLLSSPPEWVQRCGLQWVQRLLEEPRRLWRRYLLLNPVFLSMLGAQLTHAWRPTVIENSMPCGEDIPG